MENVSNMKFLNGNAWLLVGGALALLPNDAMAKQKTTRHKPNIIYILADDMGIGDLGCYGQQKIKTPNIDHMAKEGMLFTQHYAGAAVSAPSRCSLLTGLHTGHSAVRGLPKFSASGRPVDMTDEDITLGNLLQKNGYRTAIIGKWGLAEGGMQSMPLRRGFDYFFGYKTHEDAHHYYPTYLWRNNEKVALPQNNTKAKTGDYSNDLFTKEALEYIRKNQDEPFFLYLAYTTPHLELTVPADSKKQYENLGWPVRKMYNDHYYNDKDGNTAYAGMISRMDDYVKLILQQLKALGMDENTIVCFSSDNGPEYDNGFFNSNGSLRGVKRELYEGGIRAPFIVRWPGTIKAGSRTHHVSAFWDVLPTICELTRTKSEIKTDGISFLPTLLGKKQKEHDYLYWETNMKQGPIQAVRMGKWKGVKFLDKPFQLYDLTIDPREQHNVAADNAGIVEKMEQIMATGRTPHPEYVLDRWVYKLPTPKAAARANKKADKGAK